MTINNSLYEKALEYTHSLLRFGSRPGLERLSRLLSALGNPERDLKFIHIAGTNGKGSVCRMLAQISQNERLKTGLYTSPYVTEFLERIMINGACASKELFGKTALAVKKIIDKNSLDITEFEFITAVAFCIFKEEKCDIVILETGLGGRFDATNVVIPEISVITSISLDHMSVLGGTVEKIAFEKAGIVKQNIPCVTDFYNGVSVKEVIKQACLEKNSPFLISTQPEIIKSDLSGSIFKIDGKKYQISLIGRHQARNASLAVSAASLAGFSEKSIKSGLLSAVNPARFEIFSKSPAVILDGGHNIGCAEEIRKTIIENRLNENLTAIIGMMADKDIKGFISKIAPLCSRVIAVTPSNPRSANGKDLAKIAAEYCKNTVTSDIDSALESANGNTVICGSLYLAGEIRAKLQKRFKNN